MYQTSERERERERRSLLLSERRELQVRGTSRRTSLERPSNVRRTSIRPLNVRCNSGTQGPLNVGRAPAVLSATTNNDHRYRVVAEPVNQAAFAWHQLDYLNLFGATDANARRFFSLLLFVFLLFPVFSFCLLLKKCSFRCLAHQSTRILRKREKLARTRFLRARATLTWPTIPAQVPAAAAVSSRREPRLREQRPAARVEYERRRDPRAASEDASFARFPPTKIPVCVCVSLSLSLSHGPFWETRRESLEKLCNERRGSFSGVYRKRAGGSAPRAILPLSLSLSLVLQKNELSHRAARWRAPAQFAHNGRSRPRASGPRSASRASPEEILSRRATTRRARTSRTRRGP